jgi:hypothetical protein
MRVFCKKSRASCSGCSGCSGLFHLILIYRAGSFLILERKKREEGEKKLVLDRTTHYTHYTPYTAGEAKGECGRYSSAV